MKKAGTIIFTDLITLIKFWAYVNYGDVWVGLALFNDWERLTPIERKEIEIVMKPEDARAVLDALRAALETEPPVMREVAVIAFADAETGERLPSLSAMTHPP